MQRQADSDATRGDGLAKAVAGCRADAEFLARLADILDRAENAIASHACNGCGGCCNFQQAGHRLYVSTGELAMLSAAAPPQQLQPGRCPYQLDKLCTARQRRAMGCRLFFCEAGTAASAEVYERFHAEIRALHEEFAAPYHYVELTAGLAEISD